MNYDWSDVTRILEYFPNLNELKLCFNRISVIDYVKIRALEKLKVLDLETNPINEWKNLKKLGELQE